MKYISTKKISSYLSNKRYTSCSTTGSLKGMKKYYGYNNEKES